MEKGLVSIIVAVYNVEKYIKRGINSLQNQTYENLQILLIDDCSSDSSWDTCRLLAETDRRIELYKMPTNRGIAAVRNYGITLSRGEFIGFFDPDDYVDNDFILTLYNAAIGNNTKISVCNAYRQDEYGIEYTDDTGETMNISPDELFKSTMLHCSFGVWNKLWHHSLFQNFFFNEKIKSGSDLDTYKLIFTVKLITYVGKAKYHYLYNSASVSHKNNISFRLCRLEIIDEMIEYIKKNKPHLLNYAYFLSCRTRRNFIITLIHSRERNQELIKKEINITRKSYHECKHLFSLIEKISFRILFCLPTFLPHFMLIIQKLRLNH